MEAAMAAARFVERLNEQIAYEFAASQQYIANAGLLRRRDALPRLAASSTRRRWRSATTR